MILILTFAMCGIAGTSEPARYILPGGDRSLDLHAEWAEMIDNPALDVDPLPAQW